MKAEMLVVEDEPTLRTTIIRVLSSLGLKVTGVGSVSEAKEMFLAHSFSFVMSDMLLPDGTGAEFHSWVTRNFPRGSCKFFFCSGGMSEELKRYVRDTQCPLFTKPFDVSQIIGFLDVTGAGPKSTRRAPSTDGVVPKGL